MPWLDSIYPTDGQQAGSKRGTCSTDSGVPAEVEAQHGDSKVIFSKPVQVTTQFITSDGTDSGNLVSVTQFYTQNGKLIEHPASTVNGNQHDESSDDFCSDRVAVTQDAC